MNRLRTSLVGLALVLTAACDGDSQRKMDALIKENEGLRKELTEAKQELEDLKFGASRLLGQIEAETKTEAWQKVKSLADELLRRHPTSPEAAQAKTALSRADAALKKAERDAKLAETKRQEEERKKQLAEKRRLAAALSKMRKTVDKIEDVTWYRDQSSPRYTNEDGFFLYIGQRQQGRPWLRFRVQYSASDWLFIESFLVVADGRRFEYDGTRFERDNSSEIWEWYDTPASPQDLAMLQAVIESKTAVIRFNGRQIPPRSNDRSFGEGRITKRSRRLQGPGRNMRFSQKPDSLKRGANMGALLKVAAVSIVVTLGLVKPAEACEVKLVFNRWCLGAPRSGSANLNSAISGNSGYKVGPKAV